MRLTSKEILETIRMIELEHLDIRTVTLGINLIDCADEDSQACADKIYRKITEKARDLVNVVTQVSGEFGIPIINKRISVTPISYVGAACRDSNYVRLAHALDRAASTVGVDYLAGFSALAHKDLQDNDRALINAIPEALSTTERVCSSVSLGSSKSGINMDAVLLFAQAVKKAAELSAERDGIACAKLVAFANITEDNPFIAGAMHGFGEGETTINVGISGPGVVRAVLQRLPEVDLGEVAEAIKKTAYKITRMGELTAREVARRLGIKFGIIDLSLAPTPAPGDSVADILELFGLEKCGTHGTTAALAMLTDAVKKGGAMASSYVGGLSGAFIPVSEDAGMVSAVEAGALSLDKLEAMTSVCSVGLDMVPIPGDTPVETIAGIIADELAIGMMNSKTTAVRILPVPGKKAGEFVEYGGLLGSSQIMKVNPFSSAKFVRRGGRIPAPMKNLGN